MFPFVHFNILFMVLSKGYFLSFRCLWKLIAEWMSTPLKLIERRNQGRLLGSHSFDSIFVVVLFWTCVKVHVPVANSGCTSFNFMQKPFFVLRNRVLFFNQHFTQVVGKTLCGLTHPMGCGQCKEYCFDCYVFITLALMIRVADISVVFERSKYWQLLLQL